MAFGFDNVPPIGQQITDNALEGNLGGIISTRPTAKYMSGARCVLRINGEVVGFAFRVSWKIENHYREICTIDNELPDELAPRRIRVEGTISALHIPGLGPGVKLWQPDVLSFLFHKYVVIEVRDSATNQLLFYAPKAVFVSRTEEIGVDDLAQISLSFMSIGYRDEKDPSPPLNVDTLAPSKQQLGDFPINQTQTINQASGYISPEPTESLV